MGLSPFAQPRANGCPILSHGSPVAMLAGLGFRGVPLDDSLGYHGWLRNHDKKKRSLAMPLRAVPFWPVILWLLASTPASAMDILWTRMTGQYAVESAPLVADLDGRGTPEIIAVNRMGQVMRWGLDGGNRGPGQDGTVIQLPEGTWTSSATLVGQPEQRRIILASNEGLVVALDRGLHKVLWRHKLSGGLPFCCAVPALLTTAQGLGLGFGDKRGAVTCLGLDGKVLWNAELKSGQCGTELQVVPGAKEGPVLLAPCGSTLYALGPDGGVRWSQCLGHEIVTRPVLFSHDGKPAVVCGAGELIAVSLDRGAILWKRPLSVEISDSPALLPASTDGKPLILYSGLWGNLYAVDTAGQPVWQAVFHSKCRSRPLLCDLNGDGRPEILVTGYNQRLYEFSAGGALLDEVRLSGRLNASPTLLPTPGARIGTIPDLLVVTAAEQAYRLRPGTLHSTYGDGGGPEGVKVKLIDQQTAVVENPKGALLRVNVSCNTKDGGMARQGTLTARSRFELPLPKGAIDFRAIVEDRQGREVARLSQGSLAFSSPSSTPAEPTLSLWSEPAYATFDPARLFPDHLAKGDSPIFAASCRENRDSPRNGSCGAVEIHNLYQNEVDQAALIVAAYCKEPLRARVTVSPLATADKKPFGGTLTLREVVQTGTVNGEPAADALPALGDAGLIMLLPHRAAKIWISVDAHGAQPGVYEGNITAQPLLGAPAAQTIPIRVEVLDLALDKHFPLALCTWDYVPNNWFHDHTRAVLDDMVRHGVNIWPRSDCVPSAKAGVDGKLTWDWSKSDAALVRLKGRGKVLFHINTPPITFATAPSAEAKHAAELAYLRQWRDHLREAGWDYADYAFYPLDEPGLNHGKNVHILVDAAKLFREADPKLRIYTDPVPDLCWNDFLRIEPLIDVWCPNMRLVTGLVCSDPRMRHILASKKAAHKTVWSYECVSQVKSLSPLRYNRANAWRAEFFGLDGIGFWTHSTTNIDHWLPGKTINDEYALVYPGIRPVPSVRWEAVRDGLEDIAAMKLLERAIAANRANPAKAQLVRRAEGELRIARIDMMEMSDEVFLESRDFLRQGDRRLWHTPTDVETYARHRARFAELTEALQK